MAEDVIFNLLSRMRSQRNGGMEERLLIYAICPISASAKKAPHILLIV